MKNSNKAVRNGEFVTLTYNGVEVTFEWPYSVLVVAQDADGDVWAYNSLEVYPNLNYLGGIFCHSNEESFEFNESSKISGDFACTEAWADSLVEYKL